MNAMLPATERKHFYQFDIVKFLAAILIVPVHYQEFTGLYNERFNFFGGWIPVAYLVELFFILSGLFTAMQLERDRGIPFLQFMQKKVVRLWPMCALSVTVLAITGWMYRVMTGKWFLDLPIGFWIYTKSVLLIFAGGGTCQQRAQRSALVYLRSADLLCPVQISSVHCGQMAFAADISLCGHDPDRHRDTAIRHRSAVPQLACGARICGFFPRYCIIRFYTEIPQHKVA